MVKIVIALFALSALTNIVYGQDPFCLNGTWDSKEKVCCPLTDGDGNDVCIRSDGTRQCGGSGCSDLPGGEELCCLTPIRETGRVCKEVDAPCYVENPEDRERLPIPFEPIENPEYNNPYLFDYQKECLDYCDLRTKKIELSDSDFDSSDPTDTYLKIIDGLKEVATQGGGTLELGAGTWTVSGDHPDRPNVHQIYLYSNTCLKGAGMNVTTIKLMDNAPGFEKSGFVRSALEDHVTVMDLTLDGNKANQDSDDPVTYYGRYGFFSETNNFVCMFRTRITDFQGYGFDPHGDKVNWGNMLYLDHCHADNNGYDGFTLDQSFYITATNCEAYSNYRHGFNVVTGSRYVYVGHNIAEGNGYNYKYGPVGSGIVAQNNQAFGTKDVIIEENILGENSRQSIRINDVENVTILGNKMVKNIGTSSCLKLNLVQTVSVKNNRCYEAKDWLSLSDTSDYTFENNMWNGCLVGDNNQVSSECNGWSDTPDNTCSTGILGTGSNTDVCCLDTCGQCGGSGCGGLDGGSDACCTSGVRSTERYCDEVGPPCVVRSTTSPSPSPPPASPSPPPASPSPPPASPSPSPTPDNTCSLGTLGTGTNSDICCLSTCGSCGGSGCSQREGGAEGCCTSTIRESERYCDEVSAPCIVRETQSPPTEPVVEDFYSSEWSGTCDNRSGNVCCDSACDKCVDTGCGSKFNLNDGSGVFANERCCKTAIVNSGRICGPGVGPPCIIHGNNSRKLLRPF